METFFLEIREVRKGLWAFFLLVLFGCWLVGQVNPDHMETTDLLLLSNGNHWSLAFIQWNPLIFCFYPMETTDLLLLSSATWDRNIDARKHTSSRRGRQGGNDVYSFRESTTYAVMEATIRKWEIETRWPTRSGNCIPGWNHCTESGCVYHWGEVLLSGCEHAGQGWARVYNKKKRYVTNEWFSLRARRVNVRFLRVLGRGNDCVWSRVFIADLSTISHLNAKLIISTL